MRLADYNRRRKLRAGGPVPKTGFAKDKLKLDSYIDSARSANFSRDVENILGKNNPTELGASRFGFEMIPSSRASQSELDGSNKPDYISRMREDMFGQPTWSPGDGSLLRQGVSQTIPISEEEPISPTDPTKKSSSSKASVGKSTDNTNTRLNDFSNFPGISRAGTPSTQYIDSSNDPNNPDLRSLDRQINSDSGKIDFDIKSESPIESPIESGKSGSDTKGFGNMALQLLPDAINFATGLLSKDKTRPATKVNRSALSSVPNKFNISPTLDANRSSYVSILRDPNATVNQKLAALFMKQQADSAAYSEKENRENAMKSDRASIEASLDAQQAQYDNAYREDRMASDANRGIGGNFARTALSSVSNKLLQMKGEKNKEKMDNKMISALLAGKDKQVKDEFFKMWNK